MKPVRIQRSRQYKQVSPNGLPIVYVGRGSRWGNPFRIVKCKNKKWRIETDGSDTCKELFIKHCRYFYETRDEAAIDAIECYRRWLAIVKIDIQHLKGRNLSCWCRLKEKCHADLLIQLSNQ
jgi:hypothetical protein